MIETQGQLEIFEQYLFDHDWRHKPVMVQFGIFVRAGVEAGLDLGIENVEAVAEMKPMEVKRLGQELIQAYTDLLTISPHDEGGGELRPQSEEPAPA